jgi:anthranilate phosphoribosyltransferase
MAHLTHLLQKVLSHHALSKAEADEAMDSILSHAASEQAVALLSILKYRGETAQEIVGMLESIKRHAIVIRLSRDVLDIVGTGGDMAGTVNISTGSALLAAACGIPVVKHGNRAVSSQCGSADVLEALGVYLEIPPTAVQDCMQAANIAFLYAPLYQPILKKVSAMRRAMGMTTIFNLLGPLLNPAHAGYMLMGVSKESQVALLSDVLLELNYVKKVFIYNGQGLDELSTLGPASGYLVTQGKKIKLDIFPQALGFKTAPLASLQGGDVATNAHLLRKALSGQSNAIADALILNAGVALTIYGKSDSFKSGIELARQKLSEGKAMDCLEKLVKFTNQFRQEKCYAS